MENSTRKALPPKLITLVSALVSYIDDVDSAAAEPEKEAHNPDAE